MDKNFLNDLSKLQDGNTEVLKKLFELNELVVDGKLTICHVSTAFEKILSTTDSSVIGQSFDQYICPKDQPHLSALLSSHKNQQINIKLLFPLGNSKDDVYSMSFEQVVIEESCWLLLKHYQKVTTSTINKDSLFQTNVYPQIIIEPNTLQVIATNQAAKEILPNNIVKQRNTQLSQLINLPLIKFNSVFRHNANDTLPAPLSIPLLLADGQTEHVPIKLSEIEYEDKTAWLIQILSHSEYDEYEDDIHTDYHQLTNALFDAKECASLMMDSFGVINQINQPMCDLLKVERIRVIGQRANKVLPPQIASLISTSEESQDNITLLNPTQSFKLYQRPLRSAQGYVLGLLLELVTTIDKKQELIARAYEAVNDAGNHAVFITDHRGDITYVNKMFEHQTGYRRSAIIGQNFSILKSEDIDDVTVKNLWRTINNKNTWRGTLKHQRKSGTNYWSDLTVKPLVNNEGRIESFAALSHDVTLQKEMEKSGTYLANYDIATGLANCILAKDRLDGMLGRARRRKLFVAVIYLDISKINEIAKDRNQDIADSALLIYCNHLKNELRGEDTIARMSNNRLAIFLPDLAHVEALEVVSAKIDKVNQYSIMMEDQARRFDIRQGVSYFPDQGLDSESLLKNAEAAVINAWSTGAAIGCFSKGQSENALMHFQMRREIENIIANKKLDIVYQPIINLSDDSLHGVEAQVIWHHETYGVISNDEVYAIAEASGFIQELGYFVLEQVCADINYWTNFDITDINVSINISHGQLRNKSISEKFTELLARFDISNHRIELEIPLGHIATQWLNLDDILQQFSLLGFSLQYDKFGDRGAYISDLSNFPFKGIKLTTDYISMIDEDNNTANLVEGLVSMSRSLNLDVTAVGVSEFSQILQLQEMGCQRAQGDFLSKFVGRDGIVQFIKKGMTV